MIKIDKTYYLKIKQAMKKNHNYNLESISDIKQKLKIVWENGNPLLIGTYIGIWDTRQCVHCDNFWFDRDGNPSEENHYIESHSEDWLWDMPLNNLEDELHALFIVLENYGTEAQNERLLNFRYKWRGLMNRFPIMINAWSMLPEHPKEFGSTSNHKRISECYRKFLLAEKEIIDRMPPKPHPPFDKQIEWNKEEYLLGHKLVKEQESGKHKWAKNKISLFKWASMKYTFKGEYRSPKQIQKSYAMAKSGRTSKINPNKLPSR